MRGMTPMNPHQAPRTGNTGFVAGMTMGLGIGLVLACLGSAVGFVYVKRAGENARKGWNLVPVVVAAVDIPEDTVVTFEMISQRSVPEQFVTSSVVKPDSASYIVNQKVLVPLQAGDMLLWSQFETKKQPSMLFARADLAAGSVLAEGDVDERPVSSELITPSWIRTEDRPQAVGKKLIAPFRKGDPILWTHLDAMPSK
jgi:pilus assembly protein CpaB